MSKSGVPVVSQIAQGGNAVGNFVGNILSPKTPDLSGAGVAAATAPTGTQTQDAEEKEDQLAGRGQAANILFGTSGSAGLSTNAPIARNVLLGA